MSRVRIPSALRRLVIERAHGRCEYCLLHQDDTPLTHPVDHVIAVKHGGTTEAQNLALSCIECNLAKGTDSCGRTTVRLLRMNTSERLTQRELLIAVGQYPGF